MIGYGFENYIVILNMDEKQKLIEDLFDKDILVSKDFLDSQLDISALDKTKFERDMLVLTQDYSSVLTTQQSLVNWYDVDSYRVASEKGRNDGMYQEHLQGIATVQTTFVTPNLSTTLESQISSSSSITSLPTLDDLGSGDIVVQHSVVESSNDFFSNEPDLSPMTENMIQSNSDTAGTGMSGVSIPSLIESVHSSTITVVCSYQNKPKKFVVADFTNFFYSRYKYIESLLRTRQELSGAMTINRILAKKDKDTVTTIGLIEEIGETKNGNVMVTLEDPTGKIKVVFTKKDKDLFMAAKDLVVDEVVAITGMCSEKFIFAQNLVWPDVPINHEMKKGPVEEYAIFLSDIHVGSKLFLRDEFTKFLKWLNGLGGSAEQRAIAEKVKYIVIAGDLVDGIGIYPSQEDELEIKTIDGQYKEFTRLISQIPQDKQIVICPGNHDAVHLAEPQPIFYSEFASELIALPNVTLVTNPAMINIGKTATFEGFDVLMYHGYSFDYYVANVESIRTGGGYHRSDLIMKYLLKRRHLAPSFSSTPYHPSHEEDPLLIKKIPDIFITGHIHYCCVANYKGITMMSGSCWQGKTSFQEKLGHEPEPARVPIINLKTREVKVMRFG